MIADPEDFRSNRFHWCALATGLQAWAERRLDDSEYVKQLAYASYEAGEVKDRVKPESGDSPTDRPVRLATRTR